jgi:hypothetical protein
VYTEYWWENMFENIHLESQEEYGRINTPTEEIIHKFKHN